MLMRITLLDGLLYEKWRWQRISFGESVTNHDVMATKENLVRRSRHGEHWYPKGCEECESLEYAVLFCPFGKPWVSATPYAGKVLEVCIYIYIYLDNISNILSCLMEVYRVSVFLDYNFLLNILKWREKNYNNKKSLLLVTIKLIICGQEIFLEKKKTRWKKTDVNKAKTIQTLLCKNTAKLVAPPNLLIHVNYLAIATIINFKLF